MAQIIKSNEPLYLTKSINQILFIFRIIAIFPQCSRMCPLTSHVQTWSSLAAVKLPLLDLKIRTCSLQTGVSPELGEELLHGPLQRPSGARQGCDRAWRTLSAITHDACGPYHSSSHLHLFLLAWLHNITSILNEITTKM